VPFRSPEKHGLGDTAQVADMTSLTVVATQGEADVICSLLRAHGIQCGERATGLSAELGGGSGGWREVFVSETELGVARELIACAAD
jgi:hypothetical protein